MRLITLLIFGCLFFSTDSVAKQPGGETKLTVNKLERTLEIDLTVPSNISEVELRFYSTRNKTISKVSDISPHDPEPQRQINRIKDAHHDFWYPVVDMATDVGLEGVVEFTAGKPGACFVNGPFWKTKVSLDRPLIIPNLQLEHWENSLGIEPLDRGPARFYLRKRLTLVTSRVELQIPLLSSQWSGRIELHAVEPERSEKLAEAVVAVVEEKTSATHPVDGTDLERGRLTAALDQTLEFTLRCQNKNRLSPGYGGLYLFYDLDAATYRTNYWMWGWGPSVRLLLDASEHAEVTVDSQKLLKVATEVGESTLRFLWHAPGDPLHEISYSRWDRSNLFETGYRKSITVADSLFLAGWAWIPLYEKTKDQRYLDLTSKLCLASDQLMDRFKVLPHSYWPGKQEWSDFTLDECGFGMEGYAEIYRVTKDPRYQTIGQRFLQQHLDLLEKEDGRWRRIYRRLSDKASDSSYYARGQGWATEGLLAAHRLLPEGGNLERADRLAEHLLKAQLPSGCWPHRLGSATEEVGISEKGTALWSYLLYRLHKETGEQRHLEAARKALRWCLDNQYAGTDVEAIGSLPGCTVQSAVGYRQWFDVSCVYTSAFFGLAILEELDLQAGR